MESVFPSRCQLLTVNVSWYLWALTVRTLFLAKTDDRRADGFIFSKIQSASCFALLMISHSGAKWSRTFLQGVVRVIVEQTDVVEHFITPAAHISFSIRPTGAMGFLFILLAFSFLIDHNRRVCLFQRNQATLQTCQPRSLQTQLDLSSFFQQFLLMAVDGETVVLRGESCSLHSSWSGFLTHCFPGMLLRVGFTTSFDALKTFEVGNATQCFAAFTCWQFVGQNLITQPKPSITKRSCYFPRSKSQLAPQFFTVDGIPGGDFTLEIF